MGADPQNPQYSNPGALFGGTTDYDSTSFGGSPGVQDSPPGIGGGAVIATPVISAPLASSQLPQNMPTIPVVQGDTAGMADYIGAHTSAIMPGPAGWLPVHRAGQRHRCLAASPERCEVVMQDLSGRLPSAPLTGNSGMAATNTITSGDSNKALPGSPSESTTGKPVGTPMPSVPAAQPPSVVIDGHETQSDAPYTAPSMGGWHVASDDNGQQVGGWVTPTGYGAGVKTHLQSLAGG
jgi:hypothetical protein